MSSLTARLRPVPKPLAEPAIPARDDDIQVPSAVTTARAAVDQCRDARDLAAAALTVASGEWSARNDAGAGTAPVLRAQQALAAADKQLAAALAARDAAQTKWAPSIREHLAPRRHDATEKLAAAAYAIMSAYSELWQCAQVEVKQGVAPTSPRWFPEAHQAHRAARDLLALLRAAQQ